LIFFYFVSQLFRLNGRGFGRVDAVLVQQRTSEFVVPKPSIGAQLYSVAD
jgi:hypothetical protein